MSNSHFDKSRNEWWIRWHGDTPLDEIPEPNPSYMYGFRQGYSARQAEIDRLEKQLRCANHGHNYQPSMDGGTMVCNCGAWK